MTVKPKECAWHPPGVTCPNTPVANVRVENFKGRVCADALGQLKKIAKARGAEITHRKLRAL